VKSAALSKFSSILFFSLAFIFLFLGFYQNQWKMVPKGKFNFFQNDVEGYVMARMVWTRQHGLFANGGLLGWGDVDPRDVNEVDYENQYNAYLQNLSFQTYWPKESHPGFQGLFFSVLDHISPFSPAKNLRSFRKFTSALFALTLTGFIAWFYKEFGGLSAFFVFASIIPSQWMTLFGRNLFFVSGLFYLPMLVLLLRLQCERTGKQLSQTNLFWLVFSFILLKCLVNGYDFILPTLGMAASPLVFYGVLSRWSRDVFIKRFLIVVISASLAILTSLFILSFQVMYASGSFQNGVSSILETIQRRTVSNDPNLQAIYGAANQASLWSILKIYLSESYLYNFRLRYYTLMILFALVSALYFIVNKRKTQDSDRSRQGIALIAVTWFSLLGPLSWYTIFKSVAYFHTHMNYLPWHMPFTLFGFGLCGFFIESLWLSRNKSIG